jgi:glycosyltransferase involved in cell wall biosynthesis
MLIDQNSYVMFDSTTNEDVDVSVIVITYNHGLYIRECIDSLLMQKFENSYEIIVHDDASTDETKQILMEYYQQYPLLIKLILQKENLVSKGKKIWRDIIPHTKGKFIALCEGDDYWTSENKLSKQLEFFRTHPEFVAVYHRAMVVDKNSTFKNQIIPVYARKSRFSLRDVRNYKLPGQTSTILYRNFWSQLPDAIKEAFWTCKGIGDRKNALLFVLLGKVGCIGDVMSAYRHVIDSGTSWSACNHGKNNCKFDFESMDEMNRFAFKFFSKKVATFRRKLNIIHSASCFYHRTKRNEDLQIYLELLNSLKKKKPLFYIYKIIKNITFPMISLRNTLREIYKVMFIKHHFLNG